ncbi:MAG: PH domain-containing protein [Butyrivibrio sp.]|nr:PH domain-containing protein [Butyrivibrio sp.]
MDIKENVNESILGKGNLRFKEYGRLLFFAIPWPFTRYELYDNDFVIVSGFLNIKENDCYMYKITDVEMTRNLIQRIFGLSTILMYTSDVTDKKIVMKNVKNGAEIKDFVLQASELNRIRRRTINTQNIGFGMDIDDADDIQ